MKNILVIDDEESIRILYHDEFTDLGFRVTTAESGEEGLRLLLGDRPDLIILDIKMTGLTGIETLRRIKEFDRSIPVVLSSAYNTFKSDFGAWASDAYVVKSSDLEELKQTVLSLLA
jgi:CheY-like chemotaxis protein